MAFSVCVWSLPAVAQPPRPWPRVWELEPLQGPIDTFAVSADGRTAVTRGADNRVVVWDVSSGTPLWTKEAVADKGTLVAVSPDAKIVAVQVPHWSNRGCRAFLVEGGKELTGWKTVPLGPGSLRKDPLGAEWREGPELHLHPSGATIFHPSDYRHLIVSSSRKLIYTGAAHSRHRWRIAPTGDQIAVCEIAGLLGGRIPQGQMQCRLEVRVFQLPAVEEIARLRWDELQSREWPHFADALAIDFKGRRIAIARQGVATVYDFSGQKELYEFGNDISAMIRQGDHWITGHGDGAVAGFAGKQQVFRVAALGGKVEWLKSVPGSGEDPAPRVVAYGKPQHYAVLATAKNRPHQVIVRDETSQECRVAGEWIVFRSYKTLRVFRAASPLRELPASTREMLYEEEDRRNIPVRVCGNTMFFLRGGTLHVHDLTRGHEITTLNAHRGELRKVVWGTAGRLAVRSWDRTAALDVGQRKLLGEIGHRWGVFADNHLLDPEEHSDLDAWNASACVGGTRVGLRGKDVVRVIKARGCKQIFGVTGYGKRHGALCLSDDGKRLAASRALDRRNTRVSIFEIEKTDALLTEVDLPARNIEVMVFDPTGRFLAVQTGRHTTVLDAHGKAVHAMATGPAAMGETRGCRSFAFTPNGNTVVGASFSGPVKVFDLVARKSVFEFDAPRETYSHFVEVRMSPTGKTFALYYRERNLIYWVSIDKGMERHARVLALGGEHGADFLPDGRLIVVDHRAGQLWDPATMRKARDLPALSGQEVYAAPDGKHVAVLEGATVRVFAVGD